MSLMPTFQQTQHRLAQHYLDTLRQASYAMHKGHGNRVHWFNRVEQDWGQIRHWQGWSANAARNERERAQLCLRFSIDGMEILRVRQSPPERIDWLEQALPIAQQLEDGAAERSILYELSHSYFFISMGDKAKQTAERLLELAQTAGDTFNIGRAWYIIGQSAIHVGAMEDAKHAYQTSAAILEKIGAEAELGRALQGVGRVALFTGDFPRAHEFFQRYLTIVEQSGREAELGPAYITMNHVLLALGDFLPAKDYAERAVHICLNTGFQRMLPSAWLSLAAAETELLELDAASDHYEKGIVQARAMKAISTLIDLLRCLADVEMQQGKYAEAYAHFQEAFTLANTDHILYYLCEITAGMARWHVDQNQPDEAREYLRQAAGYALELGSDNFFVSVLVPAVLLWQHMNQAELAAQWAGVLMKHKDVGIARHINIVRTRLEQALSPQRFETLAEQGKQLQLDAVVKNIQTLLETP